MAEGLTSGDVTCGGLELFVLGDPYFCGEICKAVFFLFASGFFFGDFLLGDFFSRRFFARRSIIYYNAVIPKIFFLTHCAAEPEKQTRAKTRARSRSLRQLFALFVLFSINTKTTARNIATGGRPLQQKYI